MTLKRCVRSCPIGAYEAQNAPTLSQVVDAVGYLLHLLRLRYSPPNPKLTIRERNKLIRARFAAGESQADLARDFGVSYQRIHQILNQYKSRRG